MSSIYYKDNPELYDNAKKWIEDTVDNMKECNIRFFESFSPDSNSFYFRLDGYTSDLIEKFLIIFPQFKLYNIYANDDGHITFVVTTDGNVYNQ